MADSIFSTRLTPEKIAGTDNVYSIPIYQRLIEHSLNRQRLHII